MEFIVLNPEVYRVYGSPDDRFKIIVYSVPLPIAFPGQSGDAAGYIQLQNQLGKVLKETKVDMAQSVDPPKWSPTNVQATFYADWNLPN